MNQNSQYLVGAFKTSDTTIEIYLLNPGQVFQGFGGSRSGLLVRKTASLVVREINVMVTDTEYAINAADVWARIFHVANKFKAESQS